MRLLESRRFMPTNRGTSKDSQNGSIVVEASIILPLFLALLLVLISFMYVCSIEMALQSAVSETVRQVSAHAYPLPLIYKRVSSTPLGESMGSIVEQARMAREQMIMAETLVEDFAGLLPDFVYEWMNAERQFRLKLEANATDAAKELLNQAFTPIVAHFADKPLLNPERIKVVNIILPDLIHFEKTRFALEIEYQVKLPIPFYTKQLTIRKHALEHVWVGNS